MSDKKLEFNRKAVSSDQIKLARIRKKMNREDMARQFKVTAQTVRNWENGKVPRHGTAAKLLEEFIEC